MSLVVEDGTGVADANSYVTLAEAKAYAATRGKGDSFDDSETAIVNLISAADFLDSKFDFLGAPTYFESLQWPRTSFYLEGVLFEDDAIPRAVKRAQIELALLLADGYKLAPQLSLTVTQPFVIKQKVGPLERQFAKPTDATTVLPDLSAIRAILKGYIRGSGLTVCRV